MVDLLKYNNIPVYSCGFFLNESIAIYENPGNTMCLILQCGNRWPGNWKELTNLDKELGIYSNIETLSAKQHKLVVGRLIKFSNMNTKLKYVNLKISHEPTIGGEDLNNIKSVINI